MPGKPRIKPRDLLPVAVKSRSLGNIIKVSETLEASATLNDGDDTIFTLLLINDKDANMIAEPEFSLWEGSVASANLIPNGSSIDMSQYQIMGPWNEWTEIVVTGGSIDIAIPAFALASRIYIRNISAGASTTIIARARVRYITNFDDTSI
ncbi:MAG TPA: hypothetical protein ENI23_07185 [bacterium]|nr:hypothetical protein [bacterium]